MGCTKDGFDCLIEAEYKMFASSRMAKLGCCGAAQP